MPHTSAADRRRLESLPRRELEQFQLGRLNALLETVWPGNEFYSHKLARVKRPLKSLAELAEWPFTFKEELIGAPSNGDVTNNRTWPREQYSRFHQTSGTSGRPMVVLDTPDDWQWIVECWQYVLDAAEVAAHDRALMAFSFGPHIGFWGGYDALCDRGVLVIPTGGMRTLQRLELARSQRPSIVCCTPSYALHLAEVGAQHEIDIGRLGVRLLLLAGEPGGSVPAVRQRLQELWKAEIHDHCGATEIGPWGCGDMNGTGLHVIEAEFIAEFLSLATGGSAADGEDAELVLTTLGRAGCPVIRYRTGDVVRPTWLHEGRNRFVMLAGGVLGRNDDMLVVRGVNVFPSSIDHILRSFPEVVEYRVTVYKLSEMDRLQIEIEDRLEQPARIAQEIKVRLGLNVEVSLAPLGSLPRFEGKGKRFIDQRKKCE
ncbi:MAG: phenylacetate--CoA ligase family protein [Pirellulales bacterium]|nr:phenylacetate--CoA ligase family protein [Pirellulales bacterium]